MNAKKFSENMSEPDGKYVDEATNYKKKFRKSIQGKLGLVLVCLAVVAVLGVGVYQSGLFGSKTEVAILDNGTEIVFVKSGITAPSLAAALNVTTQPLTEDELTILFPNLSVTAHAVFSDTEELMGFEGNIKNTKMVIATTDIPLLDTKIVGIEESSTVNGTSVVAGYFETDRNSVGEQNVIYYATFKLGDSTVYVENAGKKSESEDVKNDLATIIQEMINNGTFNLSAINGYYSAD